MWAQILREDWESWVMGMLMLAYIYYAWRRLVACEVKTMEILITPHRKSLYPGSLRWCTYYLAIEQFSFCLWSSQHWNALQQMQPHYNKCNRISQRKTYNKYLVLKAFTERIRHASSCLFHKSQRSRSFCPPNSALRSGYWV